MSSRKHKKNKAPVGLIVLLLFICAALLFYSVYTSSQQTSVTSLSESSLLQSDLSNDIEESHEESALKTAQPQSIPVVLPEHLEIPVCPGSSHAPDHQLRQFSYYTVCYRESYEQAELSAYCLSTEELVKNTSRSNNFRQDPEITTGSALPSDYKGSGYDRGHLTPAADMAFDEKAMSDTFYMSNMSPQTPAFNRGMWKDLESCVRDWAQRYGRIYVISGPVLEKAADAYPSIGQNNVSVPDFYYKALLAPVYKDETDRTSADDAASVIAIGFILPNQKCDGSIWDYAVCIDEIEQRTHIDFFALLDSTVQKKVESSCDITVWQ